MILCRLWLLGLLVLSELNDVGSQSVSCGPPSRPYVRFDSCSQVYGGTCNPTCEKGFTGSPTATCGPDGKWNYAYSCRPEADQQQLAASTCVPSGHTQRGNSFTVNSTGDLTKICIAVGSTDSYAMMPLRIYEGDGLYGRRLYLRLFAPYSAASNTSLSCAVISPPLRVTAGSKYTFSIEGYNALGGSVYSYSYCYGTQNPYNGGVFWKDGTADPSLDWVFQIHVTPSCGIPSQPRVIYPASCSQAYGGTCAPTCQAGYTGSPTAICGFDGKWQYGGSCDPEVLDQQQLTSWTCPVGHAQRGNTFTVNATGDLTKICLAVGSTDANPTMPFRIYAGEGYNGTRLYLQFLTPNSVASSTSLSCAVISPPLRVTAGSKYTFSIEGYNALGGSVYSYSYCYGTQNPYNGGVFWKDGVADSTLDLVFQTYITLSNSPGWQLVWSQEFDNGTRLDSAFWNYEWGFVRNGEAQWYQSDNAFIQNGKLVIEGRSLNPWAWNHPYYNPNSTDWRYSRKFINYTSASITTRGKKEFLYGRFEFRAKIPIVTGAWPAIWTLGSDMPWPSCGEVDIFEFYRIWYNDGQYIWQPHLIGSFVTGTDEQYDARWDSQRYLLTNFTDKDSAWADKFHIWRLDWDAAGMQIYVDGMLLNDISLSDTINGAIGKGTNPFEKPQYLLLSLAMGNNGGALNDTLLPMRMEVDYIRVYQRMQ